MTTTKSSIRTLLGTTAVLVATSLASAYGSENTNLSQITNGKQAAQAQTLPGAVAQTDPCGPKKTSGPLGY